MVQGDEREVRRNRGYQRLSQEREIGERGRGLGGSSILGSSRRDVACSGGSQQDGVCGKFGGSSAGRDSLRAVPSVSCRLGH